MKKLIFLTLLLFTLSLTACSNEIIDDPIDDPIIDDITCTDIQIEVDGECIDLTGQQIQLRAVLDYTKQITNYKLQVTITEDEKDFDIVMTFDDNTSSIQTLNQIDYYRDNSGVCEHTTVMNEIIVSSSLTCFSDETYLFFKNFEYTWFTVISGRYVLNQENYSNVEIFFSEMFPSSTLETFSMSASQTNISDMILELRINDEIYTLTMTISLIDQIVIEIPGEE